MINKRIILSVYIILAVSIYGQPIKNKFTHFTEKDGLSSNTAKYIMQDHLGYIWIGTYNGVTKYDGYEFKNFTVVPNDTNFLQLPLTQSLYEDTKGNIWIGSVGGVTKYDRAKNSFTLFSFYKYLQKYNREFVISDMKETSDGNILCTAYEFHYLNVKNGLFLIDVNSKSVNEINAVNDDSIKALGSISHLSNDKYLITGVKGVGEFDYKKNYIRWFPFISPQIVFTSLEDENKNLWLGTVNQGLIYYNVKDSVDVELPAFNEIQKKYKNLDVYKIIYDQKKNLFLTTNYGLMHFNVKTKELYVSEINPQNPSALHSPDVNDVLLDNSGSIWIANNDAGVSKYDIVKNNFLAYTAKVDDKNSISPGWVSDIFEYKENELWLKSSRGSLTKFNPQTETFKRELLPNNFEIFDIDKLSSGKILLAGSNGFYEVNPTKWTFERLKIPVDLSNDVVFTAIEINKRTIWFGTTSGLYIYDEINGVATNINFKTLGLSDDLSNEVNILLKDKKDNVWIGTSNGLFKYDRDSKLYSRIGSSKDFSKSLTTQVINSLYIDQDNNLWIGTWLGGLNKYNQKNGTFEHYTQKDGLPSHSVQGILGDEENGYLWLSTFDGLSRLNIKEKTFSNFGVDDGIHANQFADGSALKTSNGLFIFGGSNGMTVFNPKDIQSNLIPPKITITDFKLFGKSVLPGKNSLLEEPIYETEKLTLNYDENDIEFNFFAAHYVDPQKNQYAYKLENYEDDWRYVGNQRSAIYPNLPPGNYTFLVKASNNNEVWNEKGVKLNIKILPPWWRTIWAYIAYFLIFVLGIFTVDRLQRRRLLQKERTASAMKEAELRAVAAEAQAKVIQAENDRKTKELEEARQLQLSMLPKVLPKLPNIDIAVYMNTATEVGGDYYDFHVSMDGTLTVVVGDATGHGMKAGTMVTTAKTLFNSYAKNPDIVLTFNEMTRCIKQMQMDHLSMCMTMLKIKGNKISMSSAGMPPIYIYRKELKTVEEIEMKGMPLGSMNGFPYQLKEIEILKGDSILLMSDGFPEQMNSDNEMFGYENTKNTFLEIGDSEPNETISLLKSISSNWVDKNDITDDITFVVLQIK